MLKKLLLIVALATSMSAAAELEVGELADIPGIERGGETLAREVSGATWHQSEMWVVDNEDDGHLLAMDAAGRFASVQE